MNKENDNFLDDLIDYYDNAEDDLAGQTTVIPASVSQSAPPEETFGDTVVVNIKQKEPDKPTDDVIDEPTVVNITEDNVEPEIPADEVLGNLDVYGNVIQKDETFVKRDINPPAPTPAPTPVSASTAEGTPMKKNGNIITIDVTGNGFLYNMVRIMTGTLVFAGSGKINPLSIPDIIKSKDRSRGGITAPPEGLCLKEVFYTDE